MDAEYIDDDCSMQLATVCQVKKIVNLSESKSPKIWKKVEIQSEYLHDFAAICSDFLKGGKRNAYKESIQKLKKHLLCIGWKIEFRNDDVMRFRYFSPDGKLYYSLCKVCSDLMVTEHKETVLAIDNAKVFTDVPVPIVTIDSDCYLDSATPSDVDAIAKYVEYIKKSQGKKDKVLTENAKNYLKRSGWDLHMKQKKRKQELVYSAPSGKNYYSLYTACEAFLGEQHSSNTTISNKTVKEIQLKKASSEIKKNIRAKNAFEMKKVQLNKASSEIEEKGISLTKSHKRKRRDLRPYQIEPMNSSKHNYRSHVRSKRDCSNYECDFICSVCCDGGNILICDHCPSAFHPECVGLEEIPEGNWYCPSCKCHLCGKSEFNEFNSDAEEFLDKSILYCDQCNRGYHVGCFREKEPSMHSTCSTGSWFCSQDCSKINDYIEKILGKPNYTSENGISWTILRSNHRNEDNFDVEAAAAYHSKLNVALGVLHECFETFIEPRTQSDVISDMLFNQASELRRLNFWGVYTVILEKDDETISVATLRIFGNYVAEMPLIGTRFRYREMGMCRLLVTEIEKMLTEVGVEKFVLPAAPSMLRTWIDSFEFIQMNTSDRMSLIGFNLLNFQDAIMCYKHLSRVSSRSYVAKEKDECNQSSTNAPTSKVDEELPAFQNNKVTAHQMFPRNLMHVSANNSYEESMTVQSNNVKSFSNASEESKGCHQSSTNVYSNDFYNESTASQIIDSNNEINVALSFLTSVF